LKKGIPAADILPPDTVLDIHEDGGDMLTDFVPNISRCVIISSRVKDFFEQEGLDVEKVEYLPFIVKDKKGRVVKEPYYVANLLAKIDCMDIEKSKCSFFEDENGIEDLTDVIDVETIEVLEEKIPDEAIFFRIGEFPSHMIIRSDFVEKIKAQGFTGLNVVDQGAWL
jgi:hypothetical protein